MDYLSCLIRTKEILFLNAAVLFFFKKEIRAWKYMLDSE